MAKPCGVQPTIRSPDQGFAVDRVRTAIEVSGTEILQRLLERRGVLPAPLDDEIEVRCGPHDAMCGHRESTDDDAAHPMSVKGTENLDWLEGRLSAHRHAWHERISMRPERARSPCAGAR